MFIPFYSSKKKRSLHRRKGGGRGGGGGGSSSSSGGRGSSGSSGSSRPVSGLPSNSRGTSSYSGGGGSPVTIPAGQAFAGRTLGGGTRGQVFGSRTYGSGYPGLGARSVAGRSFPFGFWPIAWGVGATGGAGYIYHNEYGLPNNSSRPGGVLVQASIPQPGSSNTTYRILADTDTMTAVGEALASNCSISAPSPGPFTPEVNGSHPQPQEVIQYFRASSLALTLDGYNNTATLQEQDAPDSPLPSGLNLTFLDCLNNTMALSAPIVDGAYERWAHSAYPFAGVFWLLWILAHLTV